MDAHADLLVELGCEELPARLLEDQGQRLLDGLSRRLADAGFEFDPDASRRLATPRRIAVVIAGLAGRQPDRVVERRGPALELAFDAEGKPTRAAEGFANSAGVSVDDLDRLETDDGAWLLATIEQPGRYLEELFGEILQATVEDMAGARSMRWAEREDRFLRPVRWLVVMHGKKVLPMTLFGLESGSRTRGHRVHAPGPHAIKRAADYEKVLQKARVLASTESRRERIAAQLHDCAEKAGLVCREDPELLAEVANLVEWPVAVTGTFDESFLEVPAEAVVCSLTQQQKCFPLFDADGRLANRFVTMANLESADPDAMRAGFERVVRPRLSDAGFFWDRDRKRPLAEYRDRLDEIVFQDRLGSIGDKTRRMEKLAVAIARLIGADPDVTYRAAGLCKCDLVTGMVGEFPELQGVMGRYYALSSGESGEVADAIESHYLPRQAGDPLPADRAGQALALADRIDTVTGAFAAGKKPRASKDPFGLRRAGLAIVRILEDSRCPLTLDELVENAASVLRDQIEIGTETRNDVTDFLLERLRSHSAEQGIEANTFHAVASGRRGSVADFMARARALQRFADDPAAASLISANKRIRNLLRQASDEKIGDVNVKCLQDNEEKALLEAINAAAADLEQYLEHSDYSGALSRLAGLKAPVDAFFDHVLVMTEDADLRQNRLALLESLAALFSRIADVARLGRTA